MEEEKRNGYDIKIVIVVQGDETYYEFNTKEPIEYSGVALANMELDKMKKRLMDIQFQPEYEIEEGD